MYLSVLALVIIPFDLAVTAVTGYYTIPGILGETDSVMKLMNKHGDLLILVLVTWTGMMLYTPFIQAWAIAKIWPEIGSDAAFLLGTVGTLTVFIMGILTWAFRRRMALHATTPKIA